MQPTYRIDSVRVAISECPADRRGRDAPATESETDVSTVSLSHRDRHAKPSTQHNASSEQCQCGEDLDERTEVDCYEQWDALCNRERNEAYVITKLRTPSAKWRKPMLVGFVDVVEDIGISFSVVSNTFALFDRYFARGFVRDGEWSLALYACFSLAVKLYSGYAHFIVEYITSSTDGRYSIHDIVNMEQRISQDLDWYLNPPIPEMFVDIISSLLSNDQVNKHILDGELSIPLEMRRELVIHARQLCELSVRNRNYVVVKPSSIAYAAVLVAMDLMHFPAEASRWFTDILSLDHDNEETQQYINQLHGLCIAEEYNPEQLFVYDGDHTIQKTNLTPTKRDSPTGVNFNYTEDAKNNRVDDLEISSKKKRTDETL